jgi:hypothetical protein
MVVLFVVFGHIFLPPYLMPLCSLHTLLLRLAAVQGKMPRAMDHGDGSLAFLKAIHNVPWTRLVGCFVRDKKSTQHGKHGS